MENENAAAGGDVGRGERKKNWTSRGEGKREEGKGKEEKREGGKRRTRNRRTGRREEKRGERGGVRPRSCVAQRETFNSVTLGLNYHAETIVPGKIKKGASRSARRRRASRRRSSFFAGPRTIIPREEKNERGSLEYGDRNDGRERQRV